MGWKDTIEVSPDNKSSWKDTIEKTEPQGGLETFAETAIDELTLGNYPQIASALKTGFGTVGDYAQERDVERKELQRGQAENKIASGLGTGAAIAAQMAIPASGAVKLGQMAKSGLPIAKEAAKQAAKYFGAGSLVSGLKNPGDVEGEVTPLQLEERVENVISEAPLNLMAGVTGGLIDAKAAKAAAKAPTEIVKIMRPTPTKASVFVKDDAKRASEVGKFIFENKIVQAGDDAMTIMSKAEKAANTAGKNLENFIKSSASKIDAAKTVGKLSSFDPTRDLPELYSLIEESLVKRGVSGASDVASNIVEQVMSDLQTLNMVAKRQGTSISQQLGLNISGLTQMKRFMQDQVSSYDKLIGTAKGADSSSVGFDIAAKYFGKKIDDEIAQFGSDEIGKTLKKLNKQYSLASDARGLADRYAVKEFLKQDSLAPIMSSAGVGGATYLATKDPMLSAMAGAGAGMVTRGVKSLSPTTKSALKYNLPNALGQNIIPKASAYYSAYESTPELPPTPYEIQEQIRQDDRMTPGQKGRAIYELYKRTK